MIRNQFVIIEEIGDPAVESLRHCPSLDAKTRIRCPRDWRLSASWWPKIRSPPSIPQYYNAVMVRGVPGGLNWASIVPGDASFSDSRCWFFLSQASTYVDMRYTFLPNYCVCNMYIYIYVYSYIIERRKVAIIDCISAALMYIYMDISYG